MDKLARKIQRLHINWGSKVFFSLLDQGLFSASNFLLTFFLGRWLSETDYGAYSITYAIFLLLSGFYSSLIFDPMMVFGVNYSDDVLSQYFLNLIKMIILLSIILCIFGALIVLILWIIIGDNVFFSTVFSMLFSLPVIMGYWWARQACYVKSNPRQAITGDIFYSLSIFISLFIFVSLEELNGASSFIILGIAALAGTPFILHNLKITPLFSRKFSFEELKSYCKMHWNFGKWAIGSFFAYGASNLAYPILIGAVENIQLAGLFRALQNLMAPLLQINTALMSLLIPWASQQRISLGRIILRRRLIEFFILFGSVAIFYLLPINLLSSEIMRFYQKDYYMQFLWAIPLFSVIMILTAVVNSYGIVLRALEIPKVMLQAKFVSVIFIFSVGIILINQFQFLGVMIGFILAILIEMLILIRRREIFE